MNQVLLIGRLTKDPELKYSQSGKAFCKFSLAVTREYNRDEADFINCVAWDKRAETIAEYLRKGKRIALQGRLSVRSYEQNGETKWITEVIVDKFEFVDAAGSQNQQASYSQGAQSNNDAFVDNDNEEIIDDDDFPF
ncbi:single-stranded DNA-binding protein [Leptotrichia sp. OH3620_COT-345]|uniref:single-stranded DNA-binding protein n=1 Tax=Leptotrichia sp. OH3620_COT-345 TaxID=2491048 RepID=UPI000F6544C8|nr:single-stranded DNA-binding protein [Leptotrichia sp. OH3620_COT-345]RRD38427.1 single-stranded DNA-binding protein [Leptotrichia sp. OH3620_COT-345]